MEKLVCEECKEELIPLNGFYTCPACGLVSDSKVYTQDENETYIPKSQIKYVSKSEEKKFFTPIQQRLNKTISSYEMGVISDLKCRLSELQLDFAEHEIERARSIYNVLLKRQFQLKYHEKIDLAILRTMIAGQRYINLKDIRVEKLQYWYARIFHESLQCIEAVEKINESEIHESFKPFIKTIIFNLKSYIFPSSDYLASIAYKIFLTNSQFKYTESLIYRHLKINYRPLSNNQKNIVLTQKFLKKYCNQ